MCACGCVSVCVRTCLYVCAYALARAYLHVYVCAWVGVRERRVGGEHVHSSEARRSPISDHAEEHVSQKVIQKKARVTF